MKNQTKGLLLIFITEILLATLVVVLSIKVWNQNKTLKIKEKALIAIENINSEPEIKHVSKYDFLGEEQSIYIEEMCKVLNLYSVLPVSILMTENPTFDDYAVHFNKNGTIDISRWQMNDRYFWTTFKDRYWNFPDIELDPTNWKHSTYIALHHIKYLQDTLKIEDDVIMAYNCGEGAVMNGTIPASTYDYLAKVKNNMTLLKNYKEQDHE